jgi:transposase-like protein
MDDKAFAAIVGQVGVMTGEQRAALLRRLSAPALQPTVRDLLDGGTAGRPRCGHCGSERVARWGSAHGLARYRCRDCRRTFNILTGTSLARLRHRPQWLSFGAALQEAASVRKSAETCGVAVSTAFRWRHRFLAAPTANQPPRLSGIVEADETFFRRSYKGSRRWTRPTPEPGAPTRKARRRGVCTGRRGTSLEELVPVLIVRDRRQVTGDAVLPDLRAVTIAGHLLPLLAPDALLCTDASRAYAQIAREAGIHHEPINRAAGEYVRDKVFHIQNVNAYDSRLKGWMSRFHGVATKYLASYLGWRRLIERLADSINPAAIVMQCR